MIKNIFLLFFLGMFSLQLIAQKTVSITIDDVPNSIRYEKDGFQSILLKQLDSLKIPIAIFINEGLIYKTAAVSQNFSLLNDWIQKAYTTLGNHSFNHHRYSTSTIDFYKNEIINGEAITRQLAKKYHKDLKHFRFPYNDLGKDSIQHAEISAFLQEKGYTTTPFTIESSDWMYNTIYEYYLNGKQFQKAQEIGKAYVTKTLEYFEFFEQMAQKDYNRTIHQIYLCHDNRLNADYLPILVAELKKQQYRFISLDAALTDPVYQQKDTYYKKWGISWLYRWKSNKKERIQQMRNEPSIKKILELYEAIVQQQASSNSK